MVPYIRRYSGGSKSLEIQMVSIREACMVEYAGRFVGILPYGLVMTRSRLSGGIQADVPRIIFDGGFYREVGSLGNWTMDHPFDITFRDSAFEELLRFRNCWMAENPPGIITDSMICFDNVRLACAEVEEWEKT